MPYKDLYTGNQATFNSETKPIGKGACATAYKAFKEADQSPQPEPFVIKKIKKRGHRYLSPDEISKGSKKEAEINQVAAGKKSQIRPTFFRETDDHCYIVTPYFGINLEEFNKNESTKDNSSKWIPSALSFIKTFMRVTSQAVQLNEAGFEHLDLKPENIAIPEDGHHPRIIDFGFSQQLCTVLKKGRGTPAFTAPELFKPKNQKHGIKLTGKCDVFSLGVLFFHLLSVRLLGENEGNIRNFYPNGDVQIYSERIKTAKNFDRPLQEMIKRIKKYVGNAKDSEKYQSLINILKPAVEEDPKKRPNVQDFYKALAKLCYIIEIEITEGNERDRENLENHIKNSKKEIKKTAYKEAEEIQETSKLEKCQKKIHTAKRHWEEEHKKILKNIIPKSINDQRYQISKNNVIVIEYAKEGKKIKYLTPEESTMEKLKTLEKKIRVAEKLLNPTITLSSFEIIFTNKKCILAKDRSTLIQRILIAIEKILKRFCKSPTIWNSYDRKMVNDINKIIPEKKQTATYEKYSDTDHSTENTVRLNG